MEGGCEVKFALEGTFNDRGNEILPGQSVHTLLSSSLFPVLILFKIQKKKKKLKSPNKKEIKKT